MPRPKSRTPSIGTGGGGTTSGNGSSGNGSSGNGSSGNGSSGNGSSGNGSSGNGSSGNGSSGNGSSGNGGGVTGTSGTQTTIQTKTVISSQLQRLIVESQANFPEAWEKATGTSNKQTQYERVTGTTIPNLLLQDVETIATEQAEEKRIEAEQEAARIEAERIEKERLAVIEAERVKQIEQAPIYERLSDQVNQIINDINNNVIQVPDWFRNNIEWVQNGHITEQEFLTAYNYLVQEQIVHTPIEQEVITQPTVNDSITNNMITQRLDNFTIIDGRAKGTITFTATNSFNPYYYNKNIINLIQFKTLEGVNILPTVKTNNLRFTATERTETIHYDELMNESTAATVESFVWEWIDKPLGAFSKVLRFNIDTSGKIQSEGFMGAGVAISAIAFSIALGYIIDQRRKK